MAEHVDVAEELVLERFPMREESGEIRREFIEEITRAIKADDAPFLRAVVAELHEADLGDLIAALEPDDRVRLVELTGTDFHFSAPGGVPRVEQRGLGGYVGAGTLGGAVPTNVSGILYQTLADTGAIWRDSAPGCFVSPEMWPRIISGRRVFMLHSRRRPALSHNGRRKTRHCFSRTAAGWRVCWQVCRTASGTSSRSSTAPG